MITTQKRNMHSMLTFRFFCILVLPFIAWVHYSKAEGNYVSPQEASNQEGNDYNGFKKLQDSANHSVFTDNIRPIIVANTKLVVPKDIVVIRGEARYVYGYYDDSRNGSLITMYTNRPLGEGELFDIVQISKNDSLYLRDVIILSTGDVKVEWSERPPSSITVSAFDKNGTRYVGRPPLKECANFYRRVLGAQYFADAGLVDMVSQTVNKFKGKKYSLISQFDHSIAQIGLWRRTSISSEQGDVVNLVTEKVGNETKYLKQVNIWTNNLVNFSWVMKPPSCVTIVVKDKNRQSIAQVSKQANGIEFYQAILLGKSLSGTLLLNMVTQVTKKIKGMTFYLVEKLEISPGEIQLWSRSSVMSPNGNHIDLVLRRIKKRTVYLKRARLLPNGYVRLYWFTKFVTNTILVAEKKKRSYIGQLADLENGIEFYRKAVAAQRSPNTSIMDMIMQVTGDFNGQTYYLLNEIEYKALGKIHLWSRSSVDAKEGDQIDLVTKGEDETEYLKQLTMSPMGSVDLQWSLERPSFVNIVVESENGQYVAQLSEPHNGIPFYRKILLAQRSPSKSILKLVTQVTKEMNGRTYYLTYQIDSLVAQIKAWSSSPISAENGNQISLVTNERRDYRQYLKESEKLQDGKIIATWVDDPVSSTIFRSVRKSGNESVVMPTSGTVWEYITFSAASVEPPSSAHDIGDQEESKDVSTSSNISDRLRKGSGRVVLAIPAMDVTVSQTDDAVNDRNSTKVLNTGDPATNVTSTGIKVSSFSGFDGKTTDSSPKPNVRANTTNRYLGSSVFIPEDTVFPFFNSFDNPNIAGFLEPDNRSITEHINIMPLFASPAVTKTISPTDFDNLNISSLHKSDDTSNINMSLVSSVIPTKSNSISADSIDGLNATGSTKWNEDPSTGKLNSTTSGAVPTKLILSRYNFDDLQTTSPPKLYDYASTANRSSSSTTAPTGITTVGPQNRTAPLTSDERSGIETTSAVSPPAVTPTVIKAVPPSHFDDQNVQSSHKSADIRTENGSSTAFTMTQTAMVSVSPDGEKDDVQNIASLTEWSRNSTANGSLASSGATTAERIILSPKGRDDQNINNVSKSSYSFDTRFDTSASSTNTSTTGTSTFINANEDQKVAPSAKPGDNLFTANGSSTSPAGILTKIITSSPKDFELQNARSLSKLGDRSSTASNTLISLTAISKEHTAVPHDDGVNDRNIEQSPTVVSGSETNKSSYFTGTSFTNSSAAVTPVPVEHIVSAEPVARLSTSVLRLWVASEQYTNFTQDESSSAETTEFNLIFQVNGTHKDAVIVPLLPLSEKLPNSLYTSVVESVSISLTKRNEWCRKTKSTNERRISTEDCINLCKALARDAPIPFATPSDQQYPFCKFGSGSRTAFTWFLTFFGVMLVAFKNK